MAIFRILICMKKSIKSIFFVFITLISVQGFSATISAWKTGNWSDRSVWIHPETGTVSASTGSITVTGSGTNFITDLSVGDHIVIISSNSYVSVGTVASIESGTSLTLTANAAYGAAGVAFYSNTNAPGNSDDVIIGKSNHTEPITVTVDVNASVNSLTLDKGNSSTRTGPHGVFTVAIAAGYSLTVTGTTDLLLTNSNDCHNYINVSGNFTTASMRLNGYGSGTGNRYAELYIADGGVATVTGDIIATSKVQSRVTATGTGRLNLGGDFVDLNSTSLYSTSMTVSFASTSTINLNGTDRLQALMLTASTVYGNVYFNNTGTNVATLYGDITSTNVTGDFIVQSGTFTNLGSTSVGALNGATYAINGNADKTIQVNNGSMLKLTGTSSFPSGFGTVSLQATSTVDYTGGNQTISAVSYGNLVVSAGASARTVTLANSGTIGVATTFSPSFTNNTYTVTGSIVYFNGASSQSIPSGFTFNHLVLDNSVGVILSGSSTVNGDITINAAKIFVLESGAALTVNGNVTNNGTFTDNGGITTFSGSSAQSVTGVIAFSGFTLNNNFGLTLNNATTVKGILTITAGTLASGGNLTVDLNSGAIAGTGSGAISGNLTVIKTPSYSKYHMLSSPLGGATAAELNDDVPIGTNKLYYYNETIADTNKQVGWTAISSTSATLNTMQGYALNFSSAVPVDITGTYSHTTAPSDVTLTNTISGKEEADGWSLVGNPFPSAIDWDAATGWTKTNLADAIYFWDPINHRYATYIAGAGTNGGTRYIPSMQGFWVKVSATGGTGTLGMNNDVRVTSTNPSLWKVAGSSNTLKLKASSGSHSDETIIRFRYDASKSFDNYVDGYKMINGGSTPSLSSVLGTDDYSINSLPFQTEDITIPLKLQAAFTGTYTFTAEGTGGLEGVDSVILDDRVLGIRKNLSLEASYTTDVVKGDVVGRFYIHFVKTPVITSSTGIKQHSVIVTSSGKRIDIKVEDASSKTASIAVCNTLGQVLYLSEESDLNSGHYSLFLSQAETGIHVVKVVTNGLSESFKVFLSE